MEYTAIILSIHSHSHRQYRQHRMSLGGLRGVPVPDHLQFQHLKRSPPASRPYKTKNAPMLGIGIACSVGKAASACLISDIRLISISTDISVISYQYQLFISQCPYGIRLIPDAASLGKSGYRLPISY
eukprot:scaffold24481_cov125-Isochrysis_galbana.AAC.4